MTRINPDDPRWTAYILGELDDTERAAVELELKSSEEARLLVEELRFAADFAKAELRAGGAAAPLKAEERDRIYASAAASGVVRPRRWLGARPAVWASGLAAAGIALMAALSPLLMRSPVSSTNLTAATTAPAAADTALPPVSIAEVQKPGAPVAPAAAPEQRHPASEFEFRYAHPGAPVTASRSADNLQDENALKQNDSKLQPGAVNEKAQQSAAADASVAEAIPPPPVAPGPVVRETAGPRTGARAAGGGAAGRGAVRQNQESLQSESKALKAEGQQGQQGQQNEPQYAQGGAVGGVLGGVLRSQIQQQAFAVPATPPAVNTASPAPGVPPIFDRIPPRNYNGGEAYAGITDNPFLPVGKNPLSTFSIDVDTASYSNIRRFLNQGQMPPRDAVRIEEMVNYFSYDYPQPAGNNPIGATLESAAAPWNPQHRLVRIGIKARDIGAQRRPPGNLVFLLDVSGSMQPAERLPLLKDGIRMLVQQLTANDRVTIVTYAGTTGVALPPTRGDQQDVILRLLDSLQAGGSTNGGSGIQLAYEQAMANFIPGGVNRIILATDGDFNVGITDRNRLLGMIEEKAKTGVFLTVLGVGMGNYKDATLEMLADKGHGNYAYLDTLNEARKVLVDQMSATFVTAAKDVKVQVEFNPAIVDAYRLIGYENRALKNEDFNNDLKDAGDMGAGHTVTALYEVVPRGVSINAPGIDPLKYQQPAAPAPAANASNETLNVKIRYKEPTATDSRLLMFPLVDREQNFARSSSDFRFAAAVASFGMLLRDSPYRGTATMDSVLAIAEDSTGSDRNGYRREFMQLVQRARQIRGR